MHHACVSNLPAEFVQSGQESKLVDCRTGVYNLKTPLACTPVKYFDKRHWPTALYTSFYYSFYSVAFTKTGLMGKN